MTADFIAYHATERPEAVAFVNEGRAIGYAEMSADIGRLARALGALGLARGHSIAVGADDVYVHWLLLLAAERLGIAAASFQLGEQRAAPLLASVDLVLSEPHFSTAGATRHHALTPAWLQSVLALPAEGAAPGPPKRPDDPVRIVRTSGTTATSKRFLVLRRMHEAVGAQWSWAFGLTRRSRFLVTLPLIVRATYDLGSACLRAGGTVVVETRTGLAATLSAHGITHAILLPINLKTVLDDLPPDFAKPRELTIVSFGAALARALRERATQRLASALCDLYGTVEAAAVSAIWRPDTDGFGTLLPSVQADAVDERGEPVPLGEIGRLRVKTDGMSEGYLDDPETTRRMFRDGWFYPGDVAVFRPGRQLKVLGRADDLLNIGGNKFLPADLEDQLANQVPAADVGVSSIENADGIEELCVAVSTDAYDSPELRDRIARAFGDAQLGRYYIVRLARIPRTAIGKIERKALKEAVARTLAAR
jgi:2,3-dihydroxybenzoate-AMP ligase